jgi:hypothetical protein
MTSQAWNSALDRIEADLVTIEDAIESGRPVPDCAPAELPTLALPEELGSRAAALLERTRALEARATEEIDGIRDCLRALAGRRAPAPAPTGRIVDVGA